MDVSKRKMITLITAACVILLVGILFLISIMLRQSRVPTSVITIAAPTNGTVVSPGQTVPISVSPAALSSHIWVFAQTPLPGVVLGSSPGAFTLTIPTTMPLGQYTLTATYVDSGGTVTYSSPVNLDVETSAAVAALNISPSPINFSAVGDYIPLQVSANMTDGGTIDITHSTRTTYTSANSDIATVDANGVVTAVGAGSTKIDISYGSLSTSVPITVPKTGGE
ncbi:MAG: Ig-like domain-containing protein [Minisyncoccia bacterium]